MILGDKHVRTWTYHTHQRSSVSMEGSTKTTAAIDRTLDVTMDVAVGVHEADALEKLLHVATNVLLRVQQGVKGQPDRRLSPPHPQNHSTCVRVKPGRSDRPVKS